MTEREPPSGRTDQDAEFGNVENSEVNVTQIGGDQINIFHTATLPITTGIIVLLVIVGLLLLPASVTDPVLRAIMPPTPLEATPFPQTEVGVVLANFTRIDPDTPNIEPNLEREFTNAAVPFVRVHHPLVTREDARNVANLYNGTLIIWGEVAEGGVNVNVEVIPRRGDLRTDIDRMAVSVTDLDSFEAYIFEGMDTLYIVDFVRGQLHFYDDDFENALRFLENAVQRIPDGRAEELQASALYFYLGATQQKLNQLTEAVASYDRAIQLNPDDALAMNNRGAAQVRLGNLDAAIADFEQSIAVGNAETADPYNNLGVVYVEQGNYTAAVDAFTQAINARPDDANLVYNRGIAYAYQTSYEAAIDDYQRAIDLNPDDAAFYNSLGFAYAQLDDFENAIEALLTTIALDDAIAAPYGTLASIYDARNDTQQAVTNYQRYIELARTDADPVAVERLEELQNAGGE